MGERGYFRKVWIVPVILAFLACPALAATSGGKGSHHPGQDCSGCHKGSVMSNGKRSMISTTSSTSTGTGSGSAQPAPAAPKGAPAR